VITYDRTQAVARMRSLEHAPAVFTAAERAKLPLAAACALLEKESGGANVWGHDPGGVFCGLSGEVTRELFRAFLWEIRHNNRQSNGVGPCQITYKGHFDVMEQRGLLAWVPRDNMTYGFELLKAEYDSHDHSWVAAGTAYNGAVAYGEDLAAKVKTWHTLLAPARVTQ
jgi:hypothetical protein